MSRRRAPTDAERHLWNSVIRDVRRLVPKDAIEMPPDKPGLPVVISKPPSPVRPVTTKSTMPGPVDGATLERLRRGQIVVDARIDLHGLDQRQAFATLMRFIDEAAHGQRRALLVITGKGAINQGGGVLRRNVPLWLMASPVAGRILTIVPAHSRHGGDGALYILLRHKRP